MSENVEHVWWSELRQNGMLISPAVLDEFLDKGYPMTNMDTGEPLRSIRERILSANAYLGAFPLADALRTGADVVVSGRCADAALALAPAIYSFGWRPTDHNLLAAGMVAGHIIECGAQVTGGNSLADWASLGTRMPRGNGNRRLGACSAWASLADRN